MLNKLIGPLLILISASCFGVMGVLAKYAYALGVNVGTLLLFRFLLAAVLFWALVFRAKIPWRVTIRKVAILALMGSCGYALMAVLLFNSYRLLPVSLASMVYYLYPAFVVVLMKTISKTSMKLNQLIALGISLTGLNMMLAADFTHINLAGVLFSLGCSMIYSIYIIMTEKIQYTIHVILSSAYITTFAAITLLVYTLLNHDLNVLFEPRGWRPVAAIAFFSTFLAIITFAMGLKLVGSSSAALLSTFEPIVTVILGVYLLNETLGEMQTIGILLILISAVLSQAPIKAANRMFGKDKSLS